MKTLLLSLILSCSLAYADNDCESLSTPDFIDELVQIHDEHMQMPIEKVQLDYQSGIAFIVKIFGVDSEQYKLALSFLTDTKDMNIEDIDVVESLRIQIIPILEPKNIYKGQHELLMKKCRENLLAAMILT